MNEAVPRLAALLRLDVPPADARACGIGPCRTVVACRRHPGRSRGGYGLQFGDSSQARRISKRSGMLPVPRYHLNQDFADVPGILLILADEVVR